MKYKTNTCSNCGDNIKIYLYEIHRDICESCEEIEEDIKDFARSVELIKSALSQQNRMKFDNMSEKEKQYIVASAFRDKILTFKVKTSRK